MRLLEAHGYANVGGLKREFAIEVDDYDDKEKLIHHLFSKSRIANTELFAIDAEIIKSLFASFDGKIVYLKNKTKRAVFSQASEEIKLQADLGFIPDGTYTLQRIVKGFGKVCGKAIVKNGKLILQKGRLCAPSNQDNSPAICRKAKLMNNVLQVNLICPSPSSAGWVVLGKSNNGWSEWKNATGKPISYYRCHSNG